MKPPAFAYQAPTSVDAALAALAGGDGDARPLGSGQSLVPLLNFRLGAPGMLVDLGRIPELVGVTIDDDAVTVAAMTPVARLLKPDVADALPLLAAAARLVGHPQIRSRGTVGGSIAHADPAAELPAAALLLGASIELTSPRGVRSIAAEDFFLGVFETACEWDELVSAVRFPRTGARWGFREFARRPGDFALAGIGVTVNGDTRVVAFGLAPTPVLVPADREGLRAALDPSDTLHGSGEYRRHLAGVLFERALEDAA